MTDLMKISSALANSDLFKSLQDTNDTLSGGGGTEYKRISLKGSKFRMIVNGDQVGSPRTDDLHLIIIDAAPVSRTYYEGAYDPSADAKPPTCWSPDGKAPSDKVPADQKQGDKCATCPMAIKGSGQGTSAACRFSQKIAVALEGDLETVYQLSLPAKSIFGAAEAGHMPMQAYAKHLKAHKVPAVALITKMYFDENSDTPKVFFKPERMLTEAELETVVELRDSDEVKDALEMTVSETDKVPLIAEKPSPVPQEEDAPKAAPKRKAKAKPEPEPEEEEVIEEPVKVTKKKPAPVEDIDDELADLIDDWED